ncbi:MAG: SIMPL domain-containing protein [Candidatus Paceibacterota bacterium]
MFNENTVMGKRMINLASVLAIFLIVILGIHIVKSLGSSGHKGGYGETKNTIVVAGKGEVIAIPDIATINFSVVEQATTVSEAQNKATAKMNKALDTLKGLGVEEKDVKTIDYSAYPRYEYLSQVCTMYSCPPSGTQKLIGYEVRQSIMVKIRNIADAGKILGNIGETGVSDISGLNFTVDDQDAKVREARKSAIDDAKEQAKQLAKDLGVRLGDIVSFNESGNYPMPMYAVKDMAMGMGGSAESAPQLPAGESKITSNVTIVYEIK